MTLAEMVFADLRAAIESQQGPPCKLTFSALAKHYGVSLTPVRAAVKMLVEAGYLVPRSNRRLQVSANLPKRRRSAKSQPTTARQDLEAEIRSEMIRLSLVGDSRFIREGATADKYNIGRTALRPILSRLAGQGLLEYIPRCGWRVRAFDKKDLCDFLDVREALELKALVTARPRLQKETLEQFLQGNQPGGELRRGCLNNNLHSYWIRLSENRYIIEFFERRALYYTTLFDYAAPEARVAEEMAAQHRQILEALLADRWNEAKKALVKHIRDQKPIVVGLMEQIQSRGQAPLVSNRQVS